MTRHHMIDGVKVAFSDAENAARNAEEAAWADGAVDREWVEVRARRNRLLAESDWRGMSDLTMSDAWKTYRQTLRDLPANTADPANPVWPDEPA